MKTFLVSTITLLICVILAGQPAEGAIKREELELHSATPEFNQALIERIKSGRRTNEQDLMDLYEVIAAMDEFGITIDDLKVTEPEFLQLCGKVMVKRIKELKKGIKDPHTHPVDRGIFQKQMEDLVKLAPMYQVNKEDIDKALKGD